jgi:anti-sigma-K factor RskA
MNQQQSEAYWLAAELDPLGGVESEAARELRRLHEVNTELREKVAAMEKSYEDLASNLALANKNARMFQQRWQLAERLSPRRQGPINLDYCGAPHLKED